MPKRIEAPLGDRIVIGNGTRERHMVETTGGADRFGRRNAVHKHAIPVDGKFLKPGSYDVG